MSKPLKKIARDAALHEKTVMDISTSSIEDMPRRPRKKASKPRNGRVVVRRWYEGVDSRIVAYVRSLEIDDYRKVQVISPVEVIVWNHPYLF